MKDAKAFTKYIAWLAISVIVGIGVKSMVSADTVDKNVKKIEKQAIPTHTSSASPFVLEETCLPNEYVSKESIARDSVSKKSSNTKLQPNSPTKRVLILDDS